MAGLLATIVIFTKLKYMNKNIILAGTSLLFSVSAIAQNEVADTVTTMKRAKTRERNRYSTSRHCTYIWAELLTDKIFCARTF